MHTKEVKHQDVDEIDEIDVCGSNVAFWLSWTVLLLEQRKGFFPDVLWFFVVFFIMAQCTCGSFS